MNLTKAAISRPVTMLMIMLVVFLLGFLSYVSMPKELNPDVNFGAVTINTSWPGADPDEVNTLVTKKIEDAVSGVNGIRQITSTSLQGVSSVTVNLNLDVDLDAALNDVRSKVDTAIPNLPKEVNKPTVLKLDTTSQPVLYMAFSATGLNNRDLRDLIDNHIQDQFAQIPGVSSVSVVGGDVREIQVRLDKSKMLAYGVGINDVQQALANSTLNQPAGHVVVGTQDYDVRVLGEFTSVDQIRNMVFTVSDPNNQQAKPATVRLGDIANVVDTVQERTQYSQYNGNDTIIVSLQKSRDGNTVDVVNGAKGVIKTLLATYKADGLHIDITNDQGKQVSDAITDLNFDLLFGILLVAAVVYLFLHNFRGMMIVALAIPFSIFGAFIALKLAGFTINNLTMLALTLAIGVLVDDAIVIVENVYRHLKLGETPREAAINGRAELGLAAIAITMADVVVFLPIAFLPGIVGEFLKPLALSYVFATLISLFTSFTITPMLAARWYRQGEDFEHPTGRFARAFESGFGKLERGYGRALEWALHHRWFIFISGLIVLMSTFMFIAGSFAPTAKLAAMSTLGPIKLVMMISFIAVLCNLGFRRFKPQLLVYGFLFALMFPLAAMIGHGYRQWKGEDVFKFQFFPTSDAGLVDVNVELPAGSNLAATQQVVSRIEAIALKDPDVKNVIASLGSQSFSTFATGNQGSNYAQVTISLYDKPAFLDQIAFWKKSTAYERHKTDTEVSADLMQAIGHVPGAIISVAPGSSFNAGSALQLSFTGTNRDQIIATASKVADMLKKGAVPGVINIDLSSKPGKPEERVIPNRLELADSNISVAALASALTVMYQGDDNVKYRVNGDEYTIRTMLSYRDRNNPNDLTEVPIAFKNGNPIFVGSVASIERGSALDKINRLDRLEQVQINADLLPGYAAGSVQNQINALIKKPGVLPAGVTYKPLGQADEQARDMPGMILAFGIGILLVYMLLASLYENLLYPLIIQIAQPQAFVGGLLALIITNEPLSLIGFIGIIALVGIVAKNAILLVDYTNTLRSRGRNRHDALVEAGPTRLRPIMMTSLSLILGLSPIALSLGRGGDFRQTMGTIIIGGVTLSTLLTLLVIPCSYTIFDDFSLLLGRLFNFLTGGNRSSGSGGGSGTGTQPIPSPQTSQSS